MTKRILIIDSGLKDRKTLTLVLKRWAQAGVTIELWSANNALISLAKENAWTHRHWSASDKINFLSWLKAGRLKWIMWRNSWSRPYDAIVMVSWPEKILFSGLATRASAKLFWLETTLFRLDKLRPAWQEKLKRHSAKAMVLAVNQELSEALANFGYKADNIRLVPYCGLTGLMQVDLFQNLAQHFKLRKDYFTIGAKVDWSDTTVAEILIKALKQCLEVSPYFQLVLLGDGPGREQIKWLIKRWQLETFVWLVGEQGQNEKWLEGFQILTLATKTPNWDDLVLGATAISRSVMVMGQLGTICEDLLAESRGQLVDLMDSSALAEKWLAFSQNEALKREYPYLIKPFAKELISVETLADKLLTMI
jgi:hypothetical protein